MSARTRLVLACVTVAAMHLPAQISAPELAPVRSPLERAEHAYRAGAYAEAAAAWREALGTQTAPDARIDYNLGNCAFRLGDYARAIWRYERAARVLRDHEQLAFNLALARRRVGLGEDAAEGFLRSTGAQLEAWDRGDWLRLGLPLELAGLVLFVLAWRRRARGPAYAALGLALIGSAALVVGLLRTPEPASRAIVLEPHTEVRAEPRRELDARARLGAGVSVRVLESSPGWLHVAGRGMQGWIERDRAGLY